MYTWRWYLISEYWLKVTSYSHCRDEYFLFASLMRPPENAFGNVFYNWCRRY